MNEGARDAIRTSVPSQFRDAVQFNDNGFLQIESLKEAAKGQDVNSNIAILSRLAENDHTIQVSVGETFDYKDEQGVKQDGTFGYKEGGVLYGTSSDLSSLGFTLVPKQDQGSIDELGRLPQSANGLIQVHVNPAAREFDNTKTRGQIVAHELFAHVRLYLMVLSGKASTWLHAKDPKDRTPDHPVEKATKKAEKEAGQ